MKKEIIVVSRSCNKNSGSESGKGYHWSAALAHFYRVHLVHGNAEGFTAPDGIEESYVTPTRVNTWKFPRGYLLYSRWCEEVVDLCRRLISRHQIAGLHHATLGSFRILPRYDLLGIPYSLGPLGGGECLPPEFLLSAGLPPKQLVMETLRPWINTACVLRPKIHAVLSHSRLAIATTEQSAAVLRKGGARNVTVKFPDVVETSPVEGDVIGGRGRQAADLKKMFCLIWSGRGLWWKGGQLAIEFAHRLRKRGIAVRLDIYSEGPALPVLKKKVNRLGLEECVFFRGLVSRADLFDAYARSHLYVYPSMHDSSSSAIPEAYSAALPSMTLGIGGVSVAATPAAGLNEKFATIEQWLEAGVEKVTSWIQNPKEWVAACEAAFERSSSFNSSHLREFVGNHLTIY